jgi:hypothetical protein
MTTRRTTRIAVSSDELERLNEAKTAVLGDDAAQVPHGDFVLTAVEAYAEQHA